MKTVFIILAVCVVIFILNFEHDADVDNPNTYDKNQVHFVYPGNWTITTDTDKAGIRNINVESPGDAIAIVQVYPTEIFVDLREFVDKFSNAVRKATTVGDIGASTFSEITAEGGYTVLSERFAVTLMGERVPHTRVYRLRKTAEKSCFLICQVADEDRVKVSKGFDRIVQSFRYGAPAESRSGQ